MDESGSPKRRPLRTLRKHHKGSIRDVGVARDNPSEDFSTSWLEERVARRRPSLPVLDSEALSSNFLPGIQMNHDDLGSASTQPSSPWLSHQNKRAQDRPSVVRSRSNDSDSPKATKAQTRLRTRTIDNGAQSRASRMNGIQDRRVISADSYIQSETDQRRRTATTIMFGDDARRISERTVSATKKSRTNAIHSTAGGAAQYGPDPREPDLVATSLPTWDADSMLNAMKRTRGRMQGLVRMRWSNSTDWTVTFCCINETSGSLLFERPNKSSMDNVLIPDLRGCQIRASINREYPNRVLHIHPTGDKNVLDLHPASEVDFEGWFAAILCWQTLLHQQSPSGKRAQEQRPPPAPRRQSRSSWNSQLSKDATIIKVGKMLAYVLDDSAVASSLFAEPSNDDGKILPLKSKWIEVSCVLKDNGKLKVYIPNSATVVSVIRLSKLPRVAVQRLDASAFNTEYCIAIYPQYALSANASSQLRPVILSFDSRVPQEVWYVLCRAFTATAVHGSQQSISADSLQSPELLPGLSRLSGSTVDFRMERSLTVQVNEVKFRRRPWELSDGPDETDYILDDLNGDSSGSFFAEVLVDGQIRAKTTLRHSTDNKPSWFEKFTIAEISNGHASATIIVKKHQINGSASQQTFTKSPKSSATGLSTYNHYDGIAGDRDILCGETYIDLDKSTLSGPHERWWPLFGFSGEYIGDVKARICVENMVILFDQEYRQLSEVLHNFGNGLTLKIAEKTPTELVKLAEHLLNIYQVSEKAGDWLHSLAEEEVDGVQGELPPHRRRFAKRLESNESVDSEYSAANREATVRDMTKAATADVSLLFRGNTLFTKAMDIHMKRLGKEYLEETIGEKMRDIYMQDSDCEVDPNRAGPLHDYPKARSRLLELTREVWGLIYNSASRCPIELRMILRHVRACAEERYGDLSRSVKYSSVSGFLFLRFFCPAIFSPHLFGLIKELPKPRAHRTFTLIAKTLQALANMINLGQKEPWMEPMNQFLVNHRQEFKSFIDSICSVLTNQQAPQPSPSYSTPLAIFTRVPPPAREGFPSLPYLIDHSRNFAGLVNLWIESYDTWKTQSPLVTGTNRQRSSTLEGNLRTFHELCIDIRHRTNECYKAAERAEEREDGANSKDGVEQKWAAVAERMQNEPTAFWEPSATELTALPVIQGAKELRPFSSRGAATPRRGSAAVFEEKRPGSRLGSSAASSDGECTYTVAGALPSSRDGDRSGGDSRGVFGIFGRKKRNS